MVFSAIVGATNHVPGWQASLRTHAAWLGLTLSCEIHSLGRGDQVAFGWLLPRGTTPSAGLGSDEDLWLTTSPGSLTTAPSTAAAGPEDNLIRIHVTLGSGQVTVVVPPATPEPFYFARYGRSWILATDLRLLWRLTGAPLDLRGVYALLQFGAVPAPLTLAQGVRRVPNGHTLTVGLDGAEPVLEATFSLAAAELDGDGTSPLEVETCVVRALDQVLGREPPAALYFSGGVDSSLLAARLQALGFSRIQLINFAFGPEDPEAQHAQDVAAHLGLRCERLSFNPADVVPMLERVGYDYSFPFVDRSVIPTNLLVRASLAVIDEHGLVVEGTGADGAFGMWQPHSRVAALPQPARWALACVYHRLRLWERDSELERVARLARATWQMPPAQALVMARNVLQGIAYAVPDETRRAVEGDIRATIERLAVGLEQEAQFSLVDLVHVCAGIFAAKSFDPLRAAGRRPLYPFLEPALLRLSLSLPARVKGARGQAKAVLKGALARHLPRALIDRPKSGFVPPMRTILATGALQTYVHDVVLAASNPVLELCEPQVLRRLLTQTASGQPLTSGAHKFVWAVIFVSSWLSQVGRRVASSE